MAILKLGELVAGIRGTVGGSVYSANKSGPNVRPWTPPSNPRTPAQLIQRGRMSSHASAWQDLTQVQRNGWDAYAANAAQDLTNSLGDTYSATGFNWYCRCTNHLLSTGLPPILTAPAGARPAAPTITYLLIETPIAIDADCAIGYPANEFLNHYAAIFLAFTPSTAPLWTSRGFRLVYCAKGGFITTERIGNEVLARFGDPILGSKAYAYISKQDAEGQRSTFTTETITVVPS